MDVQEKPHAGIRESGTWVDDWTELKPKRQTSDARIVHWAHRLTDGYVVIGGRQIGR